MAKGQHDSKADQMSSLLDGGPILATRCLFWGIHLTEGQPDPNLTKCHTYLMEDHSCPLDASTGVTSELRSTGTTRCIYWGYIIPKVSMTQRLTKCQADH